MSETSSLDPSIECSWDFSTDEVQDDDTHDLTPRSSLHSKDEDQDQSSLESDLKRRRRAFEATNLELNQRLDHLISISERLLIIGLSALSFKIVTADSRDSKPSKSTLINPNPKPKPVSQTETSMT